MAKYRKITPEILLANEYKFWLAIEQVPHKCWEWPKSINKGGYGRFEFGTSGQLYRIGAHRAAYFFHTKYFPTSKDFICHRCDNPSCVNPHHLFIEDTQANVDDMNNKNRGRSKLIKDDVIKIRQLLQADVKLTFGKIAKQFGVNRPTICRIANYVTWPKLDTGPIPKRSKLDQNDRLQIVKMHQQGISARKIGNLFGVCHHTVLSVVRCGEYDGESDS